MYYIPYFKECIRLPLFTSRVQGGFPSPAEDYVEKQLDLNELLIEHPVATFYVRVEGDSMSGAAIRSGDILVVDHSLTAQSGKIVVAVFNGEFTVKRFVKKGNRLYFAAGKRELSDHTSERGGRFSGVGM